ncbi:hypothetical protein EF847_01070 [Actinobacteria bacterium YIM 96077]|uniref:Uncharacterized protein n=1 Tax=Phytoactinopolyspora halophila TaxID=1981511 RepID=A0A329R1C5_9ACTN|nr:hypothetical protein [Phytoactinopolyspora halophila]AYY11520.1 hypothetical protein EF847_01070 [Actinobacteria bacterium YIM 96077]RAW17996.1 hypothetical protein DPM12_03935 [Phytoactinopolyspora halophila]
MVEGRIARHRRSAGWRLPALLLTGLLMIITTGLPATGSPDSEAESNEFSGTTFTALDGTPAPTITGLAPNSESDLVPPPSQGHELTALDLYPPQDHATGRHVAITEAVGNTGHPDRAPPGAGQL